MPDASELAKRFRSEELAEAFVSAYDAMLGRWPLAVKSLDVGGEYGTTHVQACGPPDGKPLVLLHGGGCTSTVWFANAGVLGRAHRVYAVDQIGDAGKSVADGRPVRRAEDFMGWLDGLLDQLGLEAAAFCGHSYGAWLALSYALHSPGRVTKLALLDPTTRTLGPVYLSQLQGAVMGAPLPLWQSVLVAWPQIVGLIAATILLFVGGYVVFQRQEVRA